MLLQAFSDTANWIIYEKNSGNILDYDWISSLSIDSYLSGFFHIPFVDGWQEQIMPLDVHVIDKALSV